jgi:hypothetical protein
LHCSRAQSDAVLDTEKLRARGHNLDIKTLAVRQFIPFRGGLRVSDLCFGKGHTGTEIGVDQDDDIVTAATLRNAPPHTDTFALGAFWQEVACHL